MDKPQQSYGSSSRKAVSPRTVEGGGHVGGSSQAAAASHSSDGGHQHQQQHHQHHHQQRQRQQHQSGASGATAATGSSSSSSSSAGGGGGGGCGGGSSGGSHAASSAGSSQAGLPLVGAAGQQQQQHQHHHHHLPQSQPPPQQQKLLPRTYHLPPRHQLQPVAHHHPSPHYYHHQHHSALHHHQQQQQQQQQHQQQQQQHQQHHSAQLYPHLQAQFQAAAAAAAAAASLSPLAPLAMNSGPAGGPGQPPAGLQPSSTQSQQSQPPQQQQQQQQPPSSRDHQQAASDPSGLNITIMNITVPPPPVVPVQPTLRFVHPYATHHLPHPSHPHQPPPHSSASQVVVSSASPASNTSSQQQQQQSSSRQQQQPSPASVASSAAYSRDAVYRNVSPNVNERVVISVSSSPASSHVEYGRVGGDRPRISLLPAPASIAPAASPTAPTDYAAAHAAAAAAAAARSRAPGILAMQPQEYRPTPIDMAQIQQQQQQQEAPPFKKIRLGQPTQQLPPRTQQQPTVVQQTPECPRIASTQDTHVKQKHVQLQPLRIDTRPPAGAYTPQTEAISPTLPEPQEEAFKTTKDDILKQITNIDVEIAKRESQICKLQKKLIELEEVANQPLDCKRPIEEIFAQPKHQTLVQKIYAGNRKTAEEAHKLLDKLGPKVKLPLYNQPSDTTVYQENRTRHQCMKTRLVARLRKEHSDRATLHRQQSQTYAILVQEWHRKVDKLEATQKRKTKEAKNREFFEKIFPELRKHREDKERFNRVGSRVKSEADFEEIMDGLQEQEEELSTELKNAIKARQMEEKKMRSYAVIPPLLLDQKQRKIAFQNNNGLLRPDELEALHSERKLINVWSATEHEMFKEKYLQHPKNFGLIAQAFEQKSAQDCVQHYYLTKKAENYKQLLRKSRRTRSSRNNPNTKVNHSNATIGGPIDLLTPGVTTRLQREQQQKTQEYSQSSSSASASTSNATSSSAAAATPTTSSSTTTTSSTSISTAVISTTSSSSSSSTIVSATAASNISNSAAVNSSPEASTTTTGTTTTTITSAPVSSTASAVAVAASVPSSSASASTASVLTTNSTSAAAQAKEAREANKENKEIQQEPKDSILIKDIKEESMSSSETMVIRDIKVEGKGALSSSSNTSTATNNTTLQHEQQQQQQQKDKKKSTSTGAGSSSRSKDKKKENHSTPMETSDEESQAMDAMELSGRQLGPHPCVICQTIVEAGNQSRPLSRSQASQYGLREDQVGPGARVCNTCRCKSVRGRYTTCPLPGCPNLGSSSTKARVKRLRALPPKWNDLPVEIRESIVQEFQIPSSTTKCCSACFNRISRRMAPHFAGASGEMTDEADAIGRQWTDEELEQLRKALRENGTNWAKVSETIVGKTNHQCKNYYLTYRKKFGLDQVVAEYYQSLGEERRPCLTDEEESGSSTSSCDELAVHDTSDTASAGSPANTISSGTPTVSAASSAGSLSGGAAPVLQPAAAVFPGSQSSTASAAAAAAAVAHAVAAAAQSQQDTKVGEKQQLADLAVVSLVAPSPAITSSQQPPQTNPPTSTREDYDSSATETADEAPGSSDLDGNNVVVTLTTPGGATTSHQPASVVQTQSQAPAHPVQSPPSTTSNNNPLTVKDLMLGVIEMQLKRNPNNQGPNSSVPVSSGTPTISSILKTDHRNDITFVREYKQPTQPASMTNTVIPTRDPNLATLSVVTGPHHGHRSASSPQQISQMQATITPCPPPTSNQQSQPTSKDMLPNEGLVVMQQQTMRETEGTLDLSIKKPRQEYNHTLQPPPPHKPATHYRPEPPSAATYYHAHTHAESQARQAKSPHVYSSSPRPQAPLTPKLPKVTVPSTSHPKLSPKLTSIGTPHKTGSITHGTPVSGARYDGMLRQMTPPGNNAQPNPSTTPVGAKETGSITQGTPVHPYAVDKRGPVYDYHRSIRHSPVTTSNVPPVQPQNSGVVVSHGQSSASNQYTSYPPRQAPNYTMEQQLSSRQIIMNDYITSQQMHPRNRSSGSAEASSKNEVPTTLYCASTPPPQPRQGVIQRHNTQKHYAPPPAGLDAFASLVDVAVQQPSLPVPHPPATSSSHEGLCMSIERMYSERYAMDNRSLQNMPGSRLARQQAAQYQMAVAMQQEQREREIMREKQHEEERERMHREREKEQLHHQQQMERLAQREKDIQQEHRLREQQREQEKQHQAAVDHRIAQQQREKELQQQHQQSHEQHRLSIHQQQQQQLREKDMQQHHYRMVQQHREKEKVAAAMREQQEIQQRAMAAQKREIEMQQQAAVQRENMYLQQQKLQKQQQMQQQIAAEQQHFENERRVIEHLKEQQMYREMMERQCESPSVKGPQIYYPLITQKQAQPPPPPPPSSSRHSQSSSGQQGDVASTLTAASLIDAIITHQINLSTAKKGDGAPAARPGDRLFQSFHRDSPAEPNGVAHSPAVEENVPNSGSGSGSASSSGSKVITLGEHVDHVINKDFAPPMSSYRPYPGYQIPEDQWKRRKTGEPEPGKQPGDERQIIRVAQQKPTSSQPQSSHQSQQSVSKQQPTYQTEPVSPPEANHYPRRFYESSTATTTTSGAPSSKSHLSPLDYVKNKIVEVMRTEDDKTSSGDRNGGGGNDKDEKGVDNSPSGEMVIDESPSQPPPPAPTNFYPFNALGVHTGPPPAPPPTAGGTSIPVVKTEEPAPILSAQYEPLSDED